jgi:hypothetical protein
MDFLINESQLKAILEQQKPHNLNDDMNELYSFTKSLVEKSKRIYNINIKLLLTWGAAVGGLVMPLSDFLQTGRFNLTEDQQVLLLVGASCSFFYDNAKMLKSIYEKIQEEGLEEPFKEVLLKGKNLKEAFIKFMIASSITIGSLLEIMGYAFLIPIITDLQQIANNNADLTATGILIAKRLVASGVIVVGQVALAKTITKILKKLS